MIDMSEDWAKRKKVKPAELDAMILDMAKAMEADIEKMCPEEKGMFPLGIQASTEITRRLRKGAEFKFQSLGDVMSRVLGGTPMNEADARETVRLFTEAIVNAVRSRP